MAMLYMLTYILRCDLLATIHYDTGLPSPSPSFGLPLLNHAKLPGDKKKLDALLLPVTAPTSP